MEQKIKNKIFETSEKWNKKLKIKLLKVFGTRLKAEQKFEIFFYWKFFEHNKRKIKFLPKFSYHHKLPPIKKIHYTHRNLTWNWSSTQLNAWNIKSNLVSQFQLSRKFCRSNLMPDIIQSMPIFLSYKLNK